MPTTTLTQPGWTLVYIGGSSASDQTVNVSGGKALISLGVPSETTSAIDTGAFEGRSLLVPAAISIFVRPNGAAPVVVTWGDYAAGQSVAGYELANAAIMRAGLFNVAGDGIAAPATNLSAAAGSAGALTGTYYWTQTFVTALGETAPWSGTGTGVALSSQRGSLSNIPIGPAGTTARRIYRTKATSTDPKEYYLVGTINDNTTTTYVDNAADAALGAAVKWVPTNMGLIQTADGVVASFSGSGSVVLGQGAQASYASVSIGGQSGSPTGFRTVSIGIYAGVSVTSGKENVFSGTHAGQGISTGTGNLILGCYAGIGPNGNAGPYTVGAQNFNVLMGSGVYAQATGLGSGTVAIGYRAAYLANSADQLIAVGYFAGKYANQSRQLFIDNVERASLAAAQDQGLIYGKGESTPQTQEMRLNARVRLGWDPALALVANLPAPTAALRGFRAYVTDASVAYTGANTGTTAAGGGSNTTPVFCNGSAWVVG